jgi:hypothetical protein
MIAFRLSAAAVVLLLSIVPAPAQAVPPQSANSVETGTINGAPSYRVGSFKSEVVAAKPEWAE